MFSRCLSFKTTLNRKAYWITCHCQPRNIYKNVTDFSRSFFFYREPQRYKSWLVLSLPLYLVRKRRTEREKRDRRQCDGWWGFPPSHHPSRSPCPCISRNINERLRDDWRQASHKGLSSPTVVIWNAIQCWRIQTRTANLLRTGWWGLCVITHPVPQWI